MIEIAIALGVIGFALVAIIGILPAGLQVQRDNRSETIINQDGTFWLETIRSGARGMYDLTNYVESIEFSNTVTGVSSGLLTYNSGFNSGEQIVGLLTTPAVSNELEAVAYVSAVSGSSAEKEPELANRELAFRYRLEVRVDRAAPFALPFDTLATNLQPSLQSLPLDSLQRLHLTFSYPVIRPSKPAPRRQSYQALLSRNLVTNFVAGTPYYYFTQ